jgi:hypothetical protein
MTKWNGRRFCIFIASALPLLAENDVPVTAEHQQVVVEEGPESVVPRQTVPDEAWTVVAPLRESEWRGDDYYGEHFHTVVPFRPYSAAYAASLRGQLTNNQTRQPPLQDKEIEEPIAETDVETVGGAVEETVERDDEGVTTTDDDSPADLEESSEQGGSEVAEGGTAEEESAANETPQEREAERVEFDYSSKSAGALILEKSPGWKGASNLLTSDKDQYAIIPCEETSKSVVISLSEDILVKVVVLADYERYSSTVKEFNLLGAQAVGKWVDLGNFTAKHGSGRQEFQLEEPSWARYLKIRILSHYGDEHFLTISQVSVHGSTMLEGFHQHWEDEQEELSNSEKEEEKAPESLEADTRAEGGDVEEESSPAGDEHALSTPPVNVREISDFAGNDICITQMDTVCPKDMNFEQLLFFYSSNTHFEKMSVLSSASVCRPSRVSVYGHVALPDVLPHSVASVSSLATKNSETISSQKVLSPDLNYEPSSIVESPMISQIQQLIKTASGIDVDLRKVNSLFHSQEVGDESLGEVMMDSNSIVEEENEAESGSADDISTTPKETTVELTEVKEPARVEVNSEELKLLHQALGRFPSSECLMSIDFVEFRKRAAASKAGVVGAGNGNAAGGATELQPIFKKLTDEIKTLQGTLSLQEDFLRDSIGCYQKVLVEILAEQEESSARMDQRIEDLERAINTYLGWVQFISNFVAVITSHAFAAIEKVQSFWFSLDSEDLSFLLGTGAMLVAVLVASRILIFSAGRWVKRRFGQKSKS